MVKYYVIYINISDQNNLGESINRNELSTKLAQEKKLQNNKVMILLSLSLILLKKH